jgi:hypothetical protein
MKSSDDNTISKADRHSARGIRARQVFPAGTVSSQGFSEHSGQGGQIGDHTSTSRQNHQLSVVVERWQGEGTEGNGVWG